MVGFFRIISFVVNAVLIIAAMIFIFKNLINYFLGKDPEGFYKAFKILYYTFAIGLIIGALSYFLLIYNIE